VIEEIELTREPVAARLAPVAARVRVAAYIELTKPRITVLVMLTAAAGYFLGAGRTLNYIGLLHTLAGTGLLSSGIAALNQFMERELDGRMRRTMMRPLPMGRMTPRGAFIFGAGLTLSAELYLLLLVNPLSALLGAGVVVGYLGCYTPLKTRTSLSTLVGAFPGAVPPLLGWAAATGHVSAEGLVLFAILFLWQFPHFFAIADARDEETRPPRAPIADVDRHLGLKAWCSLRSCSCGSSRTSSPSRGCIAKTTRAQGF